MCEIPVICHFRHSLTVPKSRDFTIGFEDDLPLREHFRMNNGTSGPIVEAVAVSFLDVCRFVEGLMRLGGCKLAHRAGLNFVSYFKQCYQNSWERIGRQTRSMALNRY
jgi:hypothetical protein